MRHRGTRRQSRQALLVEGIDGVEDGIRITTHGARNLGGPLAVATRQHDLATPQREEHLASVDQPSLRCAQQLSMLERRSVLLPCV